MAEKKAGTQEREEERTVIVEECSNEVKLRRMSGEFEGRQWTSYYLVIDGDVEIKVDLDKEKKSLFNKYVPFVKVDVNEA